MSKLANDLLSPPRSLTACLVLAIASSSVSASPFCPEASRSSSLPYRLLQAPWLPLTLGILAQSPPKPPHGHHTYRSPATLVVDNCDDSGPGSLRETVAVAVSGDTIDLTELRCSTISLTTGQISIGVGDLAIRGPGQNLLTIEAGLHSRILFSAGNLSVSDLTLRLGIYYTPGGGCIRTLGDADLLRVSIQGCGIGSYSNYSAHYPESIEYSYQGGGLLIGGDLTLTSSTLFHMSGGHAGALNRPYADYAPLVSGGMAYVAGNAVIVDSKIDDGVASSNLGPASGGALSVRGNLVLSGSTISNSYTVGKQQVSYSGAGGGVFVGGTLTMEGSTITGNCAAAADFTTAFGEAGGVYVAGSGSTIVNSTIAGNGANRGGGLVAPDVVLANSTIAFNRSSGGFGGAGMIVRGDSTIESSILAGNVAAGAGTAAADLATDGTLVTVAGGNNLVMTAASTILLPPDTLQVDPLLAPLADNGGPTWTLALLPGSPALDAGNNVAGLATDQRGPGFVRVAGGRADIGAFEMQVDAIFVDGFD